MVTTTTNLLGLVKHTAWIETGYLGSGFERRALEMPPFVVDSQCFTTNKPGRA
jgi:hypothetical protein